MPALTNADFVVANLEGAVISEDKLPSLTRRKPLALANSLEVINVLRHFNVSAVSLANNHMYDFRVPVQYTIDTLDQAGIDSFGAGANLSEARQPLVIKHGSTKLKAFSFGWDVIGCLPSTDKSEGVNPLIAKHALNTIRSLRKIDNSSFVIFVMHWNYELELYPQPAHRQLAHELIRQGVDAIIGLHPHVAQGAELVGGKPVVYSLGNWFFPPRSVGSFRLAYPPITSRELAFELEIERRQVKRVCFHWHRFDSESNRLMFEKTEDFKGSFINELTPYAGMSHREYVRWFKIHRERRRGLPVYTDYRDIRINSIKDRYVRFRQALIWLLVKLGLKRGLHA